MRRRFLQFHLHMCICTLQIICVASFLLNIMKTIMSGCLSIESTPMHAYYLQCISVNMTKKLSIYIDAQQAFMHETRIPLLNF